MTDEDYTISPFERRRTGPKNEYIFRTHQHHVQQAAEAIKRRPQPAWSQLACGFTVAA